MGRSGLYVGKSHWSVDPMFEGSMRDLLVWDFALSSVAAVMKVSGGTIEDARIACGAVECVPRRLEAVENAIRGRQRSDDLGARAGELAVEGARPLNYNHFKVPLMANLVARAVRG